MPSKMPTITVTPKELLIILEHNIQRRVPTCVFSHPGLGKSSMVRQTCAKLNRKLFYYAAPAREPTELNFEMHVNETVKQVEFIRAPFRTYQEPSVVFLDEINRGLTMFQNASLSIVYDAVNELPSQCAAVMACNYDGIGVSKVIEAMRDRVMRVDLVADLPSWRTWAINEGAIDPLTLAYLSDHPEALHASLAHDPEAALKRADQELKAPNPRIWEQVSRTLDDKLPPRVERAMIAGLIGESELVRFWAYVDMYRKLATQFNIDALLMDPTTYKVPDQVSLLYAIANALSLRATPDNIGRVYQYLRRLPMEYCMFAMRASTRRTPNIARTPDFVRFATEYQEVM